MSASSSLMISLSVSLCLLFCSNLCLSYWSDAWFLCWAIFITFIAVFFNIAYSDFFAFVYIFPKRKKLVWVTKVILYRHERALQYLRDEWHHFHFFQTEELLIVFVWLNQDAETQDGLCNLVSIFELPKTQKLCRCSNHQTNSSSELSHL